MFHIHVFNDVLVFGILLYIYVLNKGRDICRGMVSSNYPLWNLWLVTSYICMLIYWKLKKCMCDFKNKLTVDAPDGWSIYYSLMIFKENKIKLHHQSS